MDDPFHLHRFVAAQEPVLMQVLEELRRGLKTGHWMWFIFPQMKGLGSSSQANFYGLASLAEAAAYRRHPILGPRLLECAQLLLQVEGRTIEQILGSVDALKFKSCMTLFAETKGAEDLFQAALVKYFDGRKDQLTLAKLGQ